MSNYFVTPWTIALQAPLSMGFSRQEYWSGLPFPSPGDLSDPEIKPASSVLQVDSLPLNQQGSLLKYIFQVIATNPTPQSPSCDEQAFLSRFLTQWS